MALLERITDSASLKALTVRELEALALEIREKIIFAVDENGGHLASNLGVVETTLALHYVFDFPFDKLLFDVGHQCYAHKIITGRKERFETIRTSGGLSGFADSEESEYDCFTAGHAGTSVAAALGFCAARDAAHNKYKVIALVGDGSAVNGTSLEAFAATPEKPENFVVILNDNGMSISKNNSGFYKSLSKSTIRRKYISTKSAFKKVFRNSVFTRFLKKCREFVKRIFNPLNFIEKLGFKYVGIVDGNDLEEMISVLTRVKNTDKAVFLHINTVKGKGLKEAEESAEKYHGVSRHMEPSENTFSAALGRELVSLASEFPKVHALTAGMKDGTGLSVFEKAFPEKFTDVGICEEYAVSLSAGMAAAGLRPFVCVYSTFIQRAFDQILHDVCIQKLPVVFCLDRAGFVGCDGKTHQGLFDLSFLTQMPGMTVLSPKDVAELRDMLRFALGKNSPVAIRYPSGKCASFPSAVKISPTDLWETLKDGSDATVLAVGNRMVKTALDIAESAEISLKVVNARCIKPLDGGLLRAVSDKPVITLEENVLRGGFGESVAAFYARNALSVPLLNCGVDDVFVPHASVDEQLVKNLLDKTNVCDKILAFCKIKW